MLGQYSSKIVIGAFVFGTGVSTGCAIVDPLNDSWEQAEENSQESSEDGAESSSDVQVVGKAESSRESEIITRAKKGSEDTESGEQGTDADQNQSGSRRNSPANSLSKSTILGDVGKNDLKGWEHRVRGIELISIGEWELAARHLNWAAELERNPKLANMVIEQLTADPEEYLGKENYSYQVRAGDTLADIAERFLGDALKFPILARYNDIAVPQGMARNIVLRIPGDRPADLAPPINETPESDAVLATPDPAQGAENPSVETVEPSTNRDQAGTRQEPVQKSEQVEENESEVTESTKSLFSRAEYHYRQGEFDEAQQLVEKILDLDSDNIRARLMRGRLQQRLN